MIPWNGETDSLLGFFLCGGRAGTVPGRYHVSSVGMTMLDTSCHTSGCAISIRVVALQAGYYVAQPPPYVRWRMGTTIPEWRGSETRVRHRSPVGDPGKPLNNAQQAGDICRCWCNATRARSGLIPASGKMLGGGFQLSVVWHKNWSAACRQRGIRGGSQSCGGRRPTIRVRLNPQFICQYSSEVEQWPEKPHVGVSNAPVGTNMAPWSNW